MARAQEIGDSGDGRGEVERAPPTPAPHTRAHTHMHTHVCTHARAQGRLLGFQMPAVCLL